MRATVSGPSEDSSTDVRDVGHSRRPMGRPPARARWPARGRARARDPASARHGSARGRTWLAAGSPVRSAVERLGIDALWEHQAAAASALAAGRHVVLTTGTASGKSLAYLLPIAADEISATGRLVTGAAPPRDPLTRAPYGGAAVRRPRCIWRRPRRWPTTRPESAPSWRCPGGGSPPWTATPIRRTGSGPATTPARADQPGSAARVVAAEPCPVGLVPAVAALRGGGRVAPLSRRVRRPGRRRAAPAATDRRALRRRPDLRGAERHRHRAGRDRRRADRDRGRRPDAGRATTTRPAAGSGSAWPVPGGHAGGRGRGAGRPGPAGRAGAHLRALPAAGRGGGADRRARAGTVRPGRRGSSAVPRRAIWRRPTADRAGLPTVRSAASPRPTLWSSGWTSPASTPWCCAATPAVEPRSGSRPAGPAAEAARPRWC